mgnify:FL=1|jgi:hypothetical protein
MFKKIVWLGFSTKGKNAKDAEKYIKSLVDGWATEFFTGYNPGYWSDKFGFEVSPNGRFSEHEQITDFETLKIIVQEVHKYKLEVFINLNAWYYTDETMPLIEQMVEEFQSLNIDGIICWNISILEYLKSINYSGKVNISTILAVYNKQAIALMLDNYNVNKVILSREVTLKEIESIVIEFPDTRFEVFWEGDFCRYNNGLCFAEHKYWAKDICTIVVNDLVTKKRFRPDFKKIIQNTELSNEEKVEALDDSYKNIFEQIEDIFLSLDLWMQDSLSLEQELIKIIRINNTRVDLYFDAMKPITDIRNKNILTFFKAVKYVNKLGSLDETKKKSFKTLESDLEQSIQSGMKHNLDKIKSVWGTAKLKAEELASFYSKWDNLNLYTYLFFSKFPNIETVKFPTRGRNYNEKLQTITQVVVAWELNKSEHFTRDLSIERAHYDLTYLFWEKLWFREMLKEF